VTSRKDVAQTAIVIDPSVVELHKDSDF